jgi:hypothetical protein
MLLHRMACGLQDPEFPIGAFADRAVKAESSVQVR